MPFWISYIQVAGLFLGLLYTPKLISGVLQGDLGKMESFLSALGWTTLIAPLLLTWN
jgi:hypothetical protein